VSRALEDFRGHDYSGQQLAGQLFEYLDLSAAQFDGADLRQAVFHHCHLAEASFRHACAGRMVARDANFYRADFQGADLRDAMFRRCVLAGADLRGVKPRGLMVALDCHSFEGVRLSEEAAKQFVYLFSLADSPLREQLRRLLPARTLERLDRLFAR
jgi:uncharacterized protein YjbI with pentapeptide repeats